MLSTSSRRCLFYLPLLLLGAEALLHLLQVIAGRIHYPYELEWMEGGMLHQVTRILHGESLYGQPSLDFVPALYMPFYYYVSSLSALIFGENLFALRVVSVIAAAVTHVLVFLIARRITGSKLTAVLAVLFYALMFRHTGFWFDVARVDSLWTLLLASAFFCLLLCKDAPTTKNILLLALVSVLAFFTKQATLFLFPFVAITFLCWFNGRLLLKFILFCIFMAVPLLAFCEFFAGKQFFFYTLQMASSHGVTLFGIKRFFEIIVVSVPFFLLASVFFFGAAGKTTQERVGWVFLVAGFMFLSGLSRAYAGAFYNVLMPLYFCLAITAAVGVGRLVERSQTSWIASAFAVLLIAGLSLDFLRYRFEPISQIPTAESRGATEELVQRIALVDGNVCVASHGYLAWLAGKHFCAHNTQVTDLVTGSDPALAQVLRDDARQKILSGYYRVIVLDREKELQDLGLQLADIPYTVTPIEYLHGPMQFPVNGVSPKLWLEFKQEKQNAR
ncbi:MAG TPA: glycosyltransferase family 39 protein [Pseudomonadales bacterium]|nr:glycosyltransferase family 39 protein [Pseudomonadales bacterium]